MSTGWITKDEHNVMHVRTAIIPDPDGDEAQLELRQLDAGGGRANQGRRLVGKQSCLSSLEQNMRDLPFSRCGQGGRLKVK